MEYQDLIASVGDSFRRAYQMEQRLVSSQVRIHQIAEFSSSMHPFRKRI
jgi:hypothetical protein